jgi:hypothetical protein
MAGIAGPTIEISSAPISTPVKSSARIFPLRCCSIIKKLFIENPRFKCLSESNPKIGFTVPIPCLFEHVQD